MLLHTFIKLWFSKITSLEQVEWIMLTTKYLLSIALINQVNLVDNIFLIEIVIQFFIIH